MPLLCVQAYTFYNDASFVEYEFSREEDEEKNTENEKHI